MVNLGSIIQDVIALRRKSAKDFAAFRKHYFGHSTPDGTFQRELTGFLAQASQKRGTRIAVAAPRGFGKSIITTCEYVIFCICYKLEDFIVIISSTQSQVADFLQNVKRELETNERLMNDFPDVYKPDKKTSLERWSQAEIVTPNDVKVLALSTGQQIRGRRYGESRPSLIILDDIETNEAVKNPESAYNLEDWLTKAVLKSGDTNTNIIFLGTLHHHNSLLAKFTDPKQVPGWISKVYKAVISYAERTDLWDKWSKIYLGLDTYKDEFGSDAARAYFEANEKEMLKGVCLLWPEHKSYYALMAQREQDGPLSFDSEYQNEPINERDCIFNLKDVQYLEDVYGSEEELLIRRGRHLLFYGACDPSMGKDREAGDFSAIVTVAIDDDTRAIYVLDVDVARRSPSKTIDAILEYSKIREYAKFGIESNQFQELMVEELRRRANEARCNLMVKEINNTNNKQIRIETLQPMIKSGKLILSKKHRALLEEMRFYPKGRHDDALDAVEMAVKLALKHTGFVRCLSV